MADTVRKTKKASVWKQNFTLLLGVVGLVIVYPIFRMIQLDQPLVYILPNLLLFTPFRQVTRELWFKNVKIDKRVKFEPKQIPEIDAKDFDMVRKIKPCPLDICHRSAILVIIGLCHIY